MRIRFFHLLFKIVTFTVFTLQSLVRALKSIKFSQSGIFGWATPNFVRKSYVIDIANSLNNDVDMAIKRKSKLKEEKTPKEEDSESLKLHKEFENLKNENLDLLNARVTLKSIIPHKRGLKISYEEDLTKNKHQKQLETDQVNVEDIIREVRSKREKMAKEREEGKSEKVNNFPLVEEGISTIPNFSKVWNGIANKRNKELAPVDQYGSHCLANKGKDFEFQTVVACMLSSQTKDEVTASCMEKLKARGLTLENILKMDVEELDSLISKVGFHSTKAKNIKKVAEILKEKYGGKVPSTKEDLESLPGIGPKMANLIQQIAFNIVDGIAVDLHVHRITNRLGWVKTKTPEETRLKLEELLPRNLWNEINPLLVGFGQTFCTAAGPGCPTCPVNKWCPTGISNLKSYR